MSFFGDSMTLISGPQAPKSLKLAVKSMFPLTHSQQGIWMEYCMSPQSTQYNLTLEWSLPGDDSSISQSKIVKVIKTLTRRYCALRSTIVVVGTPHFQEHDADIGCPNIQLISSPTDRVDTSVVTNILLKPFDLTREFAVRWYIVQHTSQLQVYLVAHHVVLDGTSMSTLSQEFLELYEGCTGEARRSIDLSYAHLIEQAWLRSQEFKDSETICLSQLSRTSPNHWAVSKPDDLNTSMQDVGDWSEIYGTSWFRVAVSLIGVMLHSYMEPQHGEDQAVAVAFAGRPKEFQNTPGHFANALPIKVPIWEHLFSKNEDHQTLRALVRSVSQNISKVKRAERLSLFDLARSARTHGIDYHAPRVAISYSPKLADDRCRLFPVEGCWDLFFVFLEDGAGIELGVSTKEPKQMNANNQVIYDPSIFTNATITAMRSSFERLTVISKSTKALPLNMIPGMPKCPSLPTDPTLAAHEMFQHHASSNPDKVALSCAESGRSMTYGELDLSSTATAHILISNGVIRECTVILHLERGFQVIQWIVATLKAGGAFVYIDPKLPESRKQSILNQTKPTVVVMGIADGKCQWLGDFRGTRVVHTDELELEISTEPLPKTEAQDLAYIIYTSGSTGEFHIQPARDFWLTSSGEPKGVMIEHGQLASFVRASNTIYKVGHGSRVLQFASFTFDASILEWSNALTSGATLCFASTPQALIGDYLADVIDSNSITFMQITPTALATIPNNRDLEYLQRISLGGEAVPEDIIKKWQRRVDIVNSYGPTETTEYLKGSKTPSSFSVGLPPPGTEIYTCDAKFSRILPPGKEGEVCVAGTQVSRGYRAQPEITATRFAVHPTLQERMYRTGDLGRIDGNGELVILGRIDREVKVRGFRISPEEIERAILHAGSGVVTVSAQVAGDGASMIAFVAPSSVDTQALLSAVKTKLPHYMVPAAIYPLDSLPVSISGKVDHKKLSAKAKELVKQSVSTIQLSRTSSNPTSHGSVSTGNSINIKNEITTSMVQIWQKVLGLSETPSTTINFFDNGGHSLMVPILSRSIMDRYPTISLRTIDLFHQSTISHQTDLVMQKLAETGALPTQSEPNSIFQAVEISPAISPQTSSSEFEGVAIIGVAGRFPGAEDADEFYNNLMKQKISIKQNSKSPTPDIPDGCLWVPRAGTISNMEDFDHRFWNITREEVMDMDPQQRLFLEVALHALNDASIDPFSHQKKNIGIFVGAAQNSYHTFTDPVHGDAFQRANRGFVAPCISARTAYHLNFRGPNITLNTNCASGTVALSLAVDALRNKRCDVAIVGGISVQMFHGGYFTQEGQIFSAKGQCRPFDIDSDGTVPSDAVVAIVLERLPDAIENKSAAYVVIAGTGIGSDGGNQKAGYQVPSPRGQSEVIKSAWEMAGLSPQQLDYVELHGSGTPIGDALELEGLKLALKELGLEGSRCIVGSNKGNLGNTQQASGLVSLIKLCKSIQNATIPPTGGLSSLNPIIDPDIPFDFALKPTKLSHNAVLAVSSAGWGGVNSHVVLKSPPQSIARSTDHQPTKQVFNRETLQAPRRNKSSTFESTSHIVKSITLVASTILGVQVHGDTDLRLAGLDSQQFLRLAQTVRQALGASMAISSFLAVPCTPTILAKNCVFKTTPTIATTLKANSKGPTFVLLPPAGGSCASLSDLSSALPEISTVIAIEYPNHLQPCGAPFSIQELAKRIFSALDDILLSGKLVILGASFGGIVGMEISRLFLAKGRYQAQDVTLVLFDSPLPSQDDSLQSSTTSSLLESDSEANINDDAPSDPSATSSAHGPESQWEAVGASNSLKTKTIKDILGAVQEENARAFHLFKMLEQPLLVKNLYLQSSAREAGEDEKESWKKMMPLMRWEVVEGGHFDDWKGRNAEEVVRILGE
ncbi:hypothetical protein G7Y89_g7005 [Cudoniella acicularis]|uniref:Ketosynthase family 3 (KS3) domain-containing protein n=1 Tax=Cudoniella acicularis TaxID=354080 RepID=A0A8H4RLL2_9HELO|nr:hypothetical protein G7Y89_g7005 [Cudoniella acicularis]